MAQTIKHLPAMRETRVQFLCREDPLEKEMAIHSSTLGWKIPWTEEPDRLQFMGWQRVGHDWATSLSLSIKLNILLAYGATVMLFGIYPKKLKEVLALHKTCTWIFMTAIFTIANTWKQPKCPSVGEWINKLCYIQMNGMLFRAKKKWAIKPWKDMKET